MEYLVHSSAGTFPAPSRASGWRTRHYAESLVLQVHVPKAKQDFCHQCGKFLGAYRWPPSHQRPGCEDEHGSYVTMAQSKLRMREQHLRVWLDSHAPHNDQEASRFSCRHPLCWNCVSCHERAERSSEEMRSVALAMKAGNDVLDL